MFKKMFFSVFTSGVLVFLIFSDCGKILLPDASFSADQRVAAFVLSNDERIESLSNAEKVSKIDASRGAVDGTSEEKIEETTEVSTTKISEEATDGTPEKKVEETKTEKSDETKVVKSETKTEPETNPPKTTEAEQAAASGGRIGRFKITGYTAEEGFVYGATTASGTIGCKPGICAMNNTRRKELGLKYGDQIYVEGLGTFTVADCGCNYNVVDIWVYTNQEAANLTGYRDVYYA